MDLLDQKEDVVKDKIKTAKEHLEFVQSVSLRLQLEQQTKRDAEEEAKRAYRSETEIPKEDLEKAQNRLARLKEEEAALKRGLGKNGMRR